MPPAFTVIIPARYGSTRLPGKPLLDIKGQPLIRHAYETAKNSQARAIYVATDDARIAAVVEGFGAEAVLTSGAHQSGADRLAERVVGTHENLFDRATTVQLGPHQPQDRCAGDGIKVRMP